MEISDGQRVTGVFVILTLSPDPAFPVPTARPGWGLGTSAWGGGGGLGPAPPWYAVNSQHHHVSCLAPHWYAVKFRQTGDTMIALCMYL